MYLFFLNSLSKLVFVSLTPFWKVVIISELLMRRTMILLRRKVWLKQGVKGKFLISN